MNESPYLAFISYRHQEKDQRVSFLLRRGLENWHMPKDAGRLKSRRVFRDTDELPTSSDLGEDIENALRGSEYLIPLCSEAYVRSKWCMREVEEYIRSGRKDRILPILLSGEPATAMPEAIRDLPPALDLRGAEGREVNHRIRLALPDLLERMSGLPRDQILARERRHRGLVVLSVLAAAVLMLTGAALYAIRTADRIAGTNLEIQAATVAAEQARDDARRERANALEKNAAYFSEKAWDAIAAGDDEEALTLAMRALPEDLHGEDPVSVEAIGALRTALSMPSTRKESYQLSNTVPTDFSIAGWMPVKEGYLILSDGTYSLSEHILDCYAGDILEVESMNRREAFEQGYGRASLIFTGSGTVKAKLFYGPEKPMHVSCDYESAPFAYDMTVGGEPFFADRIANDPEDGYFLAWREEQEPAAESPVVLFHAQQTEAIAELKTAGLPISVSYDANHRRVAVVDEAGILSLFETKTGERKAVVEGSWKQVYYPYTGRYFCAVSSDGKAYYYDAVTLEPVYEFDCDSPVKSLVYGNSEILICCEKGVRTYQSADGKLIYSLETEEEPVSAVWMRYVSNLDLAFRDGFVLLFERRAEIYLLSGDTDTSRTFSVSLHQSGSSSHSRQVFYSPDSAYLFQVTENGGVAKWNAADGTLCWIVPAEGNTNAQGHSGNIAVLSKDASILWKLILNGGSGVMKIDADTGAILYSALWSEKGNSFTAPREDSTGTRGVVEGVFESGPLVVFDTQTGEKLWEQDFNTRGAMFSPDGKEVWCILSTYREDGKQTDKIPKSFFLRLDTETGDVLEKKMICDTALSAWRDVFLDEEGYLAIVQAEGGDLILVDYRTGELVFWTGLPTQKDRTVIFPYTGGIAIRWGDPENDRTLVQRLYPDGTVGPILDAGTPEGRALATDRREYGVFAGEEIVQSPAPGTMSNTGSSLRRISDGAAMMDLKSDKEYYGIAVAPDGESLCVYGSYYIPVVIPASDADTLVDLARQRLGGQEG